MLSVFVSVYYVAVSTIVLSCHGSNLAKPVIIHDISHIIHDIIHDINADLFLFFRTIAIMEAGYCRVCSCSILSGNLFFFELCESSL